MKLKHLNRDPSFQRALMLLFIGNLVLFLVGDVANRIATSFDSNFLRFTGISKILGLIITSGFIIKHKLYKKEYAKPLMICITIFCIVFMIGNFCLKQIILIENIQSNFIFLGNACVLPFMLIAFFSLGKESTSKILKIFLTIFWMNTGFILIGYLYEIQVFKTYFYGARFGYKGLFERSTYVSYVFIFVLIYYYYKWMVHNHKNYLYYFLIAAIISILVGTKRVYFSVGLLAIFHIVYSKVYKKGLFYIFLVCIMTCIFLTKSYLFSLLNDRFGLLINIYKTDGLLTAISSYRSNLLVEYFNLIVENNWSFLNYVFGGGMFHLITPEMDLIDSYLFFGIFGPLVYWFIARNYIFNFKIYSPIVGFFLTLIIFLAFFSSGIIFSADFALPMIIFSSYFYFEHKNQAQIEE